MTELALMPAPDGNHALRVRVLLEGAVEGLMSTWHTEFGVFPFASRRSGTATVHNYAHPVCPRYTITSLLGLAVAARHERLGVTETEVGEMAARFAAVTPEPLLLAADHGLLTVLDVALGASRPALRERIGSIARLLAGPASLHMQDLAWLLWGASAAAAAGVAGAVDIVDRARTLIFAQLVDARTGLPRHSPARYRRNVVSFGSLAYFLRAMHEAAVTLGDEQANRVFERGVARTIGFQGPQGEWPWMIDCRRGRPFDRYPVFAVHQDGMAMLFLHPALDAGLMAAAPAAARSLAWDFGENELGARMFTTDPFFAYRSIERVEHAPRARRYLRSLPGRAGLDREVGRARAVRINPECRSYHLGWILYAWSGRHQRGEPESRPHPAVASA